MAPPLVIVKCAVRVATLAQEEIIISAQFVTLQILVWLVEMNAEECALELLIGEH
jgi:hypothetical protein